MACTPPSSLDLSTTTITADGHGRQRQNGQPYRDNAIASFVVGEATYQACIYWTNTANKMEVAVREIGGAWTKYNYDGTGGLPDIEIGDDTDDHHTCVLAFDPEGYLHLSYNHHNDPLNYRVSSNPIATFDGTLEAEASMLGTNETQLCYPVFFNDPAGKLYFMFRDGLAGDADTYMYSYDESTPAWSGAAGTTAGLLCAGKDNSESVYLYTPCFDADFGSGGWMHMGWHWRNSPTGPQTNHNISYVKWDGTNWKQSNGTAQTVPITPANSESADATEEDSGIAGKNGIFSDGDGNPHIVYIKGDGDDYAQAWHTWHNGSVWSTPQVLTDSEHAAEGDPTRIEYMSPDLAIDRTTGTVYVFVVGFAKKYLWVYSSSNYSTWTLQRLLAEDIGQYAPSYDPRRWSEDGVISMAVAIHLTPSVNPFDILLLEYTP